MPNAWMIRAGESGDLFNQFKHGGVAMGWHDIGNLTSCRDSDAIRARYLKAYPDQNPGEVRNGVAALAKFRVDVAVGDHVLTYSPARREYLVGQITGDYLYNASRMRGYPHLRTVPWGQLISHDSLRPASRNSLGGALTLFSLGEELWQDVQAAQHRSSHVLTEPMEEEDKEENPTDQGGHGREVPRAHQRSGDPTHRRRHGGARGCSFTRHGYRARFTPKAPDRGVDVLASPDGLGLEQPRIKAEVKHRPKSAMGAQDIRSFLGGLREGDRGLSVSTGGFTKDARYEADRAKVPCTRLDLDDLVRLVVQHDESFDVDGRALVPLVRIYWPAE